MCFPVLISNTKKLFINIAILLLILLKGDEWSKACAYDKEDGVL